MAEPFLHIAEHSQHAIEAGVAVHAECDEFVLPLAQDAALIFDPFFTRGNVGQQQAQTGNCDVDLLERGPGLRWLVASLHGLLEFYTAPWRNSSTPGLRLRILAAGPLAQGGLPPYTPG